MSSAIDRLLALADDPGRHDIPPAELLPLQLEAANERLQDRRGRIKLLAKRAEAAGTEKIGATADLVPLLFAHTAYKSYVETWLTEGRWDRMSRWLETVSTHPVRDVDLKGVEGIDAWIEALEPAGHFLACSSGTTGKPAVLSSSEADLEFSRKVTVTTITWATGMEPKGDRKLFGVAPVTSARRNNTLRDAMIEAFSSHDNCYRFEGPLITIGKTTEMIVMRRKIADGTALPAEIAAFESAAAERQAAMDGARESVAQELIDSRDQKLFITGMWGMLYPAAQTVRERGYGGKDFHPENTLFAGGGLKGNVFPPDYEEFCLETYNVKPRGFYHFYSMQEVNTPFPCCSAGRYHIPPWVILLPLDDSGDELVPVGEEETQARAGFFDISLDARWGGVISGDRISASFGKCDCGHQGPTVGHEITRYSDLAGGDKIACSGTLDAYVRGEA